MFRRWNDALEVLLAHPGGPFFRNKDDGVWTIPKGEIEPGEDLLSRARKEFEALCEADRVGTPTVLDRYGATNPVEFFAVVTEAFFERPRALRARHPELYAQFANFFRQDPVRFSGEGLPARHK